MMMRENTILLPQNSYRIPNLDEDDLDGDLDDDYDDEKTQYCF